MLDKIIDIINKKFKDSILYEENSNYILIDNPSNWKLIADYLFQNNNLKFDYLMSLSGYDLTNDKVGVAYNFYSTKLKHYLEVRIEVDSNIEIPSVAELWRTANWHEREAYDLLGLKFSNHPDMKRILLPEDWDGHPLKKDYKTPEFYNGMPVPKDKSYWE